MSFLPCAVARGTTAVHGVAPGHYTHAQGGSGALELCTGWLQGSRAVHRVDLGHYNHARGGSGALELCTG